MAANPDRRMRFLHRVRQTVQLMELVKFSAEGRRLLRPQGFKDLDILVAYGSTARKIWRVQGCKFLTQPAYPDAKRHPPTRQHIDSRQHFRGEHRVTVR